MTAMSAMTRDLGDFQAGRNWLFYYNDCPG
jgi:hypothetical protein